MKEEKQKYMNNKDLDPKFNYIRFCFYNDNGSIPRNKGEIKNLYREMKMREWDQEQTEETF